MKKAHPANRRSAAKNNATANAIEEYLAGVPEPARNTLNKVRAAIRSAAPPDTTEGISYGIPAFQYKGPLLGFAAFPEHCSLFAMSGSLLEHFKTELQGFSTSKGTIRFPLDKPVSAALIKKLVKARLAEKDRKEKNKKSP